MEFFICKKTNRILKIRLDECPVTISYNKLGWPLRMVMYRPKDYAFKTEVVDWKWDVEGNIIYYNHTNGNWWDSRVMGGHVPYIDIGGPIFYAYKTLEDKLIDHRYDGDFRLISDIYEVNIDMLKFKIQGFIEYYEELFKHKAQEIIWVVPPRYNYEEMGIMIESDD
jgi:hypothetical protein